MPKGANQPGERLLRALTLASMSKLAITRFHKLLDGNAEFKRALQAAIYFDLSRIVNGSTAAQEGFATRRETNLGLLKVLGVATERAPIETPDRGGDKAETRTVLVSRREQISAVGPGVYFATLSGLNQEELFVGNLLENALRQPTMSIREVMRRFGLADQAGKAFDGDQRLNDQLEVEDLVTILETAADNPRNEALAGLFRATAETLPTYFAEVARASGSGDFLGIGTAAR